MKRLFHYFKPYKKESIFGPLFKLLEAVFELLVPVVVARIVDKGLGESVKVGGKLTFPNADKGYIYQMIGVLFLFALVGFLCAVVAQYFAAKCATGVSSEVRKGVFSKLLSLGYSEIDGLGQAKMLTRLTDDTNQLQTGINMFLRLFLRSPFIVFGAGITAFCIDKSSSIVFFVAIPVLFLVVGLLMKASAPLYKKAQEGLEEITLTARENLSGARVIRAFALEDGEKTAFDERNARLTKKRRKAGGVSALTAPFTLVIVNVAIVVLLYTGALRVEKGTLTRGQVIALYNLFGQILVELIKFANLVVVVSKALASAKRLEETLETSSSRETLSKAKKSKDGGETNGKKDDYIVFDDVSLRYTGASAPSLEHITFSIARGETVGILGGTGAGKTTLINALLRFYQATEGSVSVLGKNINDYAESELLKKIALVPQRATLYQGTVRSNLIWGKENATDEEMRDSLKRAQALSFVDEKGGLDAVVEEKGKNFSGGQKQRLTVARALVKGAEILVLDDASSALDYATDAEMRGEIRALSPAITTIIVSQRASSVMKADKIVVLDDGKAVGIGDHEALLKTCDVYREIYFSQYGERGQAR